MGSSEALGSPSDFVESSLKTEIVDDEGVLRVSKNWLNCLA
jgi:hypothetical protein